MSTVSEENPNVHNAQATATGDQGTSTEKHDEAPHKKLEGDDLLDAIRKQVEYYFSRQNLANDPFLVQHMNNQLYVAIEFIATFKLIKNLTEDVNLIREAVKKSKTVLLDETGTKIKPDFTIPRNTVILRDIPSSTDVEVVKKIFSQDNMPKQIQSQIGDNWFVVFDTDEQALLALDQLRGKEIDGHAVHARIKTENILKAFAYYASPNTPQQPTYQQSPQQQQYAGRGGGFRNQWDQQQGGAYENRGGAPRGGSAGRGQKPNSQKGQRKNKGAEPQPQQSQPQQQQPNTPKNKGRTTPEGDKQRKPKKQEQTTPQQPQQPVQTEQQPQQGEHQDARSVGRGKRRPSFTRAHPPPSLGAKNFPPLPTISKAELLKSGYDNDKYLSYPKGAIISVYNSNLKNNNLQRPEDLPDCAAVLPNPKTQLELTKPPLPHHEVQQDPEHTEEAEEKAPQEKKASSPVENSKDSITLELPLHLPNEAPSVVKSFAEAAITAKDIKTPDFPRPPEQQPKRRNSLKGGKSHLEESPQPVAQQGATPKKNSGRRNSLGGGSRQGRRRNSLESKDGTTPQKKKEPQQSSPAPANNEESKPKRKRSNKPKKEDKAPTQSSSGASSPSSTGEQDNKSYASIVNKIKSTSPKDNTAQSPTKESTAQQQACSGTEIF